MNIMNILRGKSDNEIYYEFLSRKGVTPSEWKKVRDVMIKAKNQEIIRYFWKIPMVIFGFVLILTLIISAAKGFFPRVFITDHMTFFKLLCNVTLGISLFLFGIFCIIFPFAVEPDVKYNEYDLK
jgi:hypothetical protein